MIASESTKTKSHWYSDKLVMPSAIWKTGKALTTTFINTQSTTVTTKVLFDHIPVLNNENLSLRRLNAWNSSAKDITKKVIVLATQLPYLFKNTKKVASDKIVIAVPNTQVDKSDDLSKMLFVAFWGLRDITSFSAFSVPNAKTGKLSVTRFIHNNCDDNKNVYCGKKTEYYEINKKEYKEEEEIKIPILRYDMNRNEFKKTWKIIAI